MIDTETAPAPLVDIGLNLANRRFDQDRGEVLTRAAEANVIACVLTGTGEEESEQVLSLTREFGDQGMKLYCTAGVHPHHASAFRPESLALLKSLVAEPEVVAIGETGLDFNRDFSPRDAQEAAFEAQIELAAELQMPLFMHERDAHRRQFEILAAYRDQFPRGVIHCFTGDRRALFNYLDLDLYIGITGWICDERRGLELQRLAANIPLDRLMLETDAPYLLPRNMLKKPGDRRNEPAFLPWVLAGIAEHRSETAAVIAARTTENAGTFFGIGV